MPRPSNTHARRAQIVEAMLVVIADHGYADASVAAIAAAAGLSTGLVHYHFKSKHEVLVALVETLSARLAARVVARAAETASPRARLDAMLDAYLELSADADPRAVTAWVVLGAEAARDPAVREVLHLAATGAVRDLEGAVRDVLHVQMAVEPGGGESNDRAGAIARALYAAIEGCFRLATSAPGLLPTGSSARMVRAIAEALIAAP